MEDRDALDDDALAADLKALAHEKRIRLVRHLVEPRTLEEISSFLGVARQTAHDHLQQLLEVGLVVRLDARPDGKPGMSFQSARHRLFHVYERMGRLGDVDVRAAEQTAYRLATQAEGGPAGSSATASALPRLTIVHGLRIGHTTLLPGGGPWIVGRDPHATVCLDYDAHASARHAEIRKEDGAYVVVDLYSSNGTSVDWEPLARGGRHTLETGALLRVGRTLLAFRRPVA